MQINKFNLIILALFIFLFRSCSYGQNKINKYSYLPFINSIENRNDSSILICTNEGIFINKIDTIVRIYGKTNKIVTKTNIARKYNTTIWIGTYNSSIIRMDKYKIKEISFKHIFTVNPQIATSIFSKDNNVWIGTSEGDIVQYNSLTEKLTKFKGPNNSSIYSIFVDVSLWVATYNGIYIYNGKKWKKWKNLSIGYAIFQDEYGTNWILGRDRNNKFVIKFKNYEKWEAVSLSCFNDDLEIRNYSIDRNNNIWFTSNYGLIRFNFENEDCQTINSSSQFNKICIQNDTSLWLTNKKNDLIQISIKNNTPKKNHSVENTFECNDLIESGGSGRYEFYIDLGQNKGKFKLWYNMFNMPDKLTIHCNNQIIYQTKNEDGFPDYVSGKRNKMISFDNRIIKVIVDGNKKKTDWKCKIHCPEQ